MKQSIAALCCGLLFGAGLVVSGMTSTAKIIGFLDIFGSWDFSLLLVMGSALLITLITTPFILAKSKPVFANQFSLPDNPLIDRQLLIGATLFGIGWGLYGFCPGPALVSILYGQIESYIFIGMMLLGMYSKPIAK